MPGDYPQFFTMEIPDGQILYQVQVQQKNQVITPQKNSNVQSPLKNDTYYKCQVEDCGCTGWTKLSRPSSIIKYRDPCKCMHFMNVHTIYTKKTREKDPEPSKICNNLPVRSSNMTPPALINANVILEYQYSDQYNFTKPVSEETMIYLLGLKCTSRKRHSNIPIPIAVAKQQHLTDEIKEPAIVKQMKQTYQRNLVNIKDRKLDILLPYLTKLQKVSVYSKCQTQNCNCTGWTKTDQTMSNLLFSDLCKCEHSMEMHIKHLRNKSEEELNKVLRLVFDIENMYIIMIQSKESYVTKVYNYLIKLVGKCILTLEWPIIKTTLQHPPFEKPSIHKTVTSLVMIKFAHLAQEEWKIMHEMAMIFLHCLNVWDLPAPSKHNSIGGEDRIYTINYIRWFVFCHVPIYFESFKRNEMTKVFGITLLRAVFKPFVDQFQQIGVCLSPTRREMFELHFPIFSNALEKEVYSGGLGTDFKTLNCKRNNVTGLSEGIRESPSFARR